MLKLRDLEAVVTPTGEDSNSPPLFNMHVATGDLLNGSEEDDFTELEGPVPNGDLVSVDEKMK